MHRDEQPIPQLEGLELPPCELHGQPWAKPKLTLAGIEPIFMEGIAAKGECDKPSVAVAALRVCPCQFDFEGHMKKHREAQRQKDPAGAYVIVRGLFVFRSVICQPHLDYYREWLEYPFQCPGCGIVFRSVDDIVLQTTQL